MRLIETLLASTCFLAALTPAHANYKAQYPIINLSSYEVVEVGDFTQVTGKRLEPISGSVFLDTAYQKPETVTGIFDETKVLVETEVDRLNQIAEGTFNVQGCTFKYNISTLQMKTELKYQDKSDENCKYVILEKYTISVYSPAQDSTWNGVLAVDESVNQTGVSTNADTGAITVNPNVANDANTVYLSRPALSGPKKEDCKVEDGDEPTKCDTELEDVDYSCESNDADVTSSCATLGSGDEEHKVMQFVFNNLPSANTDITVKLTGKYTVEETDPENPDGDKVEVEKTVILEKLLHFSVA